MTIIIPTQLMPPFGSVACRNPESFRHPLLTHIFYTMLAILLVVFMILLGVAGHYGGSWSWLMLRLDGELGVEGNA